MALTTTRTGAASPDADAVLTASDLAAREADVAGTPLAAEAALPVGVADPRPRTREQEKTSRCREATHASVAGVKDQRRALMAFS